MEKNGNLILDMTLDFSLKIVAYSEKLESVKKFVIAKQVLKAGTSIGANAREAQNAESKFDFIHKMKISAKEGDETEYWLLICKHSKNYPECDYLINDLKSIQKVLNKIISSSKR